MKKLTALIAGGTGYVLGTRAGRQRYEQIRSAALRVKQNPKVQATVHQATETAKETAPVVKDKVSGAAGAAKSKVSSSDDTTMMSTTTSPTTAMPPTTPPVTPAMPSAPPAPGTSGPLA